MHLSSIRRWRPHSFTGPYSMLKGIFTLLTLATLQPPARDHGRPLSFSSPPPTPTGMVQYDRALPRLYRVMSTSMCHFYTRGADTAVRTNERLLGTFCKGKWRQAYEHAARRLCFLNAEPRFKRTTNAFASIGNIWRETQLYCQREVLTGQNCFVTCSKTFLAFVDDPFLEHVALDIVTERSSLRPRNKAPDIHSERMRKHAWLHGG